jgi:hypothetical protein
LIRRVAALAVVLTVGLAGCDSVREASDTVGQASDKVSICTQAVRLAGFVPDVANPQQAAEEAGDKAEELRRLADQAADKTLEDALNGMADKVGELRAQDISAAKVAAWATEKAEAVDALTRACT